MKNMIIVVFSFVLMSMGTISSAQVMPDYVIRTAQEINAIYGEGTIDINSTGWDFRGGSIGDGFNLTAGCNNLITLPASTTATGYHRVFFDTNFDGVDEWVVVVYSDYTYFGLCSAPRYECGTLTPRLSVGNIGHVSLEGFPNNLWSNAGESGQLIGEIPSGGEFSVIDGPRCASGISFWLVDYNGLQGWTAEGQGTEYFVISDGVPAVDAVNSTPIGSTAIPEPTGIPTFTCNGVTSRLYVGLTAQVTPGLPNNLRAQPGESGQYLGEIPPVSPFTIVGGPECNSNLLWWQVNYQGTVGWTGEAGSPDDYWLEPVSIGVESINAGTLIRLNPVATLTSDVSDSLASIYINQRNDIIGTWLDRRQWVWNPSDPTLGRPDTTWSSPTLRQLTAKPLATRLDSAGQVVMMIPSQSRSTQIQLTGGTYFDEFDLSRDNASFDIAVFHPIDGDMLVVSPRGQGFIFVDSNPDSPTYRGVSQSARILLPDEIYTQLEFSKNGQRLVGLTDKHHLVIWTGADANPATWSSNYPLILSADVIINDFSISPDGTRLLISGQRTFPNANIVTGFYSMYNLTLNGAEEIETVNFYSDIPVRAVEFSSDGTMFAIVGSSDEVIFFDTLSLTEIRRIRMFEQVTEIVFNDAMTLLATVSESNTIMVWRIR